MSVWLVASGPSPFPRGLLLHGQGQVEDRFQRNQLAGKGQQTGRCIAADRNGTVEVPMTGKFTQGDVVMAVVKRFWKDQLTVVDGFLVFGGVQFFVGVKGQLVGDTIKGKIYVDFGVRVGDGGGRVLNAGRFDGGAGGGGGEEEKEKKEEVKQHRWLHVFSARCCGHYFLF